MVEPARIASKISLVLADADGTLVTKATWLTARENDDERTARRTTLAPSLTARRQRSRRTRLHPRQRTGCSHGAIRPLLDIWALKSSTLERNTLSS
jgi:hypothetical protein